MVVSRLLALVLFASGTMLISFSSLPSLRAADCEPSATSDPASCWPAQEEDPVIPGNLGCYFDDLDTGRILWHGKRVELSGMVGSLLTGLQQHRTRRGNDGFSFRACFAVSGQAHRRISYWRRRACSCGPRPLSFFAPATNVQPELRRPAESDAELPAYRVRIDAKEGNYERSRIGEVDHPLAAWGIGGHAVFGVTAFRCDV